MKKAWLAFLYLMVANVCNRNIQAADYNQSVNLGTRLPGDTVSATATPPGNVLTGNNVNPGGFTWTGGPATFNGTIPTTFSGNHAGKFSGTYQPQGGEGKGAPLVLTWDMDTTGVVISVEVTAPAATIDGNDSGRFTVTVKPSGLTVTSYQWTWTAPAGAGNNPQVNYATPDKSTTIVKNAHWFAVPDNRLADVTGWTCDYTNNCTVTINGAQFTDPTPPTWRVFLPVPPAETSWPAIQGMVTIGVRQVGGASQWFVSGIGTVTRTAPVVTAGIPATSQFYNKVVTVHEGRHVTQLTTGVAGMTAHLLWNAGALYNNTLVNMTSNTGEADLRNRILQAIAIRNALDNASAGAQGQMAEHDAFGQSNAVGPHYLEFDVPAP